MEYMTKPLKPKTAQCPACLGICDERYIYPRKIYKKQKVTGVELVNESFGAEPPKKFFCRDCVHCWNESAITYKEALKFNPYLKKSHFKGVRSR